MTSSGINDFLNQRSTKSYFIEYGGFLSNHLSHGIIALDRLRVPLPRIERFVKWYTPKLESPWSDLDDERAFEGLRGKRAGFYKILKHYEELFYNKYGTLDELIKGEYPKLSLGLAGSALHGTIHLGYNYSAGNERGVLEGLAYTYHSFRPPVSEKHPAEFAQFGSGSKDILEVLGDIKADTALYEALRTGWKKERWVSLNIGQFQTKVCYLLGEHGEELLNYASSIKIGPQFRSDDSEIDPVKLARRAVYWSVLVYASAVNKNDFFLLHGVTCCWGIYQFTSVLDHRDAVDVIRDFITVLLCVYMVQGAPALSAKIHSEPVTEKDWEGTVDRALSGDMDEHCYKLIQVCREMARDAVSHGEDERMYFQAACNVVDNEFFYHHNFDSAP